MDRRDAKGAKVEPRCRSGSRRHGRSPIRVGISSCLLGQKVRYDGGHKRDGYITETLGRYIAWVPVCPEVEMGLGTPRETLHLLGTPAAPRLVFRETGRDITEAMNRWARSRLEGLARADLSGYILKSDSPSCGMERVKVYGRGGMPRQAGIGLFARALMGRFPLLPMEEEGRLHDMGLRENFIERAFGYWRWRRLVADGLTREKLVAFHGAHTLLLLAHSPMHYHQLGRLVAVAKAHSRSGLEKEYGELFMAALRVLATPRRHANVLHHILGSLKRDLGPRDTAELVDLIAQYARGLVPLVVPLALLKHHLARTPVASIQDQIYLNPHPSELMLRTHV